MALSLRDIIVKISLMLDPQSANDVKDEIKKAINEGTDPAETEKNTSVIEHAIEDVSQAYEDLHETAKESLEGTSEALKETSKDTRGIGDAATSASKVTKAAFQETEKAGISLKDVISAIGRTFGVYFGGRFAYRFFDDAIQKFSDFDAALQQGIAIMGNVSTATRDQMSNTALEVAKELNITQSEVASGFYYLASAGYNAQQSLKMLPQIALFAKAGMFDMSDATELLVDSQAALGYKSKDANDNLAGLVRTADVLTKANALADGSVREFAEALQNKAGAAARVVHKDIEEVTAALMVLANQGVKGATAGERVAIFLRQVNAAAVQHAEAFKKFGVQVFDANGRMLDMGVIVNNLTQKIGGLSAEQQTAALTQLGFQVRTQDMIKQMFGLGDSMLDYENKLRDASGFTKDVATKQLQTFKEQWGLVTKQIDDAKIAIGKGLVPMLMGASGAIDSDNGLVGALKRMAQWLDQNQSVVYGLGKAVNVAVDVFELFMDAMKMLSDAGVILVTAVIGPMTLALAGLAEVAAIAQQGLAKVLDVVGLHSAADAVQGTADRLKQIRDSMMDITRVMGGAQVAAWKEFWASINDNPFAKPKTAAQPSSLINQPVTGHVRQNGDNNPGGTNTDPDARAKKLAEERQKLHDQLEEALAKLTATPADDEMKKIDELEAKFRAVYTEGLPKDVVDGLAKLRAAVSADSSLHDIREQLRLVDTSDQDEALTTLSNLIDRIEAERKTVEQGTTAWEEYTEALKKASDMRQHILDDRFKKQLDDEERHEKEQARKRKQLAESVARSVSDAWQRAFTVMIDGSKKVGGVFEQFARGIGKALLGGVAAYAEKKAGENATLAAEELAKGIAATANPFLSWSAPIHFKAAAQHAGVAALWTALAGGASAVATSVGGANSGELSGGSSASDMGGNAAQNATKNGPDIYIHVDGMDPSNPRHQKLVGETARQYVERYGGNIQVGPKRSSR